MDAHAPAWCRNSLLSALPPAELAQLRPLLTRVQLVHHQVLYEAGEHVAAVFFVEGGIVSMLAEEEDGRDTGVCLIGREGMAGLSALLGSQAASFNRVVVTAPGAAFRMPAHVLRGSLEAMPVLRRLLFEALEVLLAQTAQVAACSARHPLPQRLPHWLLMIRDRVDGDELALKQETLSTLLGVRRTAITVTLRSLQEAGLVKQRRGCVLVCDRPGLEAAACGCYGRVRAFAAKMAARAPGAVGCAA